MEMQKWQHTIARLKTEKLETVKHTAIIFCAREDTPTAQKKKN